MNYNEKIVHQTPIERLWTVNGDLPAMRGRTLDREAVRELLRRGPVRFVVALVGQPLKWVPPAEQFDFWKRDGVRHLADAVEFDLDEFPGGMAYVASEWLVAGYEEPIILLEVHH